MEVLEELRIVAVAGFPADVLADAAEGLAVVVTEDPVAVGMEDAGQVAFHGGETACGGLRLGFTVLAVDEAEAILSGFLRHEARGPLGVRTALPALVVAGQQQLFPRRGGQQQVEARLLLEVRILEIPPQHDTEIRPSVLFDVRIRGKDSADLRFGRALRPLALAVLRRSAGDAHRGQDGRCENSEFHYRFRLLIYPQI